MGHRAAEISESFICSKFSNFTPEGLETVLYQNGYLEFRSPTSSKLCLKLVRSSFYVWPGDL
jgi:hypothetical protein